MGWLFHFKSTHHLWKKGIIAEVPVELNAKSSRKKLPVQCEIPAEILWKTLISSAIPVGFREIYLFSVQFQLKFHSKCLALPFSYIFCLDLEHWFSEKLSGSGMTNTLILVGIPNSSTEGVWISNGIAQFCNSLTLQISNDCPFYGYSILRIKKLYFYFQKEHSRLQVTLWMQTLQSQNSWKYNH